MATIPKRAWSIPVWCAAFDQSRSTAYALIRAGVLEARKSGRKTLLDGDSVDRWYASLPKADIKPVVSTTIDRGLEAQPSDDGTEPVTALDIRSERPPDDTGEAASQEGAEFPKDTRDSKLGRG